MNQPYGVPPGAYPPSQLGDPAADKRARWSVYLGAASLLLTCLSGIPAIVLGATAIGRASPAAKKEAIAGIGLGALTSLGAAGLFVMAAMMPHPTSSAGTATVARGSGVASASSAVATNAGTAWKPGETVKVGKCSYRLVKAYKRVAPEDDKERTHRLWETAVAVEAKHTDELDAMCMFNLQLRTVGSDRVLGEDSTANHIAPGSKKCMAEGISESVPRAMVDVRVVLQLSPDSPDDQGFLKGLARDSLKQKELEVGAQLLSWDEYGEKVGLSIDCD